MIDCRLPRIMPVAKTIVRSVIDKAAAALAEGIAAHLTAWPNGDWRSANEQIVAARQTIGLLFPETVGMENAETLALLRRWQGVQ